jgi:MscS family membrane protein
MVRKALKVFLAVLGILWIADNLGMDIAALLAGLGIGGIAIALASKDTVENFFGAVAILADRPFQVGDWIRMGDIEGTVEEVGFRTTRVRTFYNSLITFPNATLIRSSVDNLGAREYRRVKETIGVTYDTPSDKLAAFIEGIRELVRVHPYTRKDYYHVYFHSFGDSSLNILLYLFLKTPDWATELRERQRLLMDILRLAQRLGVEFAFPTRTLHMIKEAAPEHARFDSIPAAHRSGRDTARAIVDEFTGPAVPPPVVIGDRPDDAEGSGGGE